MSLLHTGIYSYRSTQSMEVLIAITYDIIFLICNINHRCNRSPIADALYSCKVTLTEEFLLLDS